ncbi:2-amino-4-hydroxy-6-hydroxymethyldihydropteridine diphosphokinase [Acidothermaceae bacterium B102]|nr:2-amino-4-hydroxy-6-hydroxymethyldihydropteridine diphosphokinase [Acidothermaceae bacterium B102]
MTVHRVAIAFGANLGDPFATFCRGLQLLAAHDEWTTTAVSSVWETDPVGGPAGQSVYLNAVVLADVPFAAPTVLGLLHVVEAACDRVRDRRWGPRTLDLDLLAYDDVVSASSSLTLPHPRAAERGFVVQPWLEVDPDAAPAGIGPLASLPAATPSAAVRRTDLLLPGPLGVQR